MLCIPVHSVGPLSSPSPDVDHVRGLDALPLAKRALERFEPAVLLTGEGLGAIHAPETAAADTRTLWFVADARALMEWESRRRQVVTLSFQSPDERVYLRLSGRTEVVADHTVAAKIWRPTFRRWFPAGVSDPRLLLVKFSTDDAEYYQTSVGRITTLLTH